MQRSFGRWGYGGKDRSKDRRGMVGQVEEEEADEEDLGSVQEQVVFMMKEVAIVT